MTDLRGRRVLVVGLGRSGLAAARFLARRGSLVTVTDQRHPKALASEARELMAQKVGLELGRHREETFISQDLIVVSPGVPPNLAALERARREGVRVVPEIELASWFLESPIVGITGTNGKTTTAALVGAILEASGFSPFVGGNIGVPLIQAAEISPPPFIIVAELSSFQLETIESFRPRVAVLLNLTPNHLDRHPTFEAYVRAKARLFENQTPEDHAILNADDAEVVKLADSIKSRKTFFSRRRELANGVFAAEGKIWCRVRHLERALMEIRDVRLRGGFNLENVLAAAAAACVAGADFAAFRRAVRDFPGVEHRLEFVRDVAGISFYNDSKATSVDAAAKALSTFERGVHLILGGKDKGAPYAPLRQLLRDRVREVLLIGAAADKIGRELSGAADLVQAGTLEAAVRRAFERARPGDTVLLSPACSSFDQFQDFEQRGRVFKELVSALADEYNEGKIRPFEAAKPDFALSAGTPNSAFEANARTRAGENETSFKARPAPPAQVIEKPAARVSPEPARPDPPPRQAEAQPSPRLRRSRKLAYVYEVSAEEFSGAGEVCNAQEELPGDVGEAAEPGPTPELPSDELMAYEVRSEAARPEAPEGSARRR